MSSTDFLPRFTPRSTLRIALLVACGACGGAEPVPEPPRDVALAEPMERTPDVPTATATSVASAAPAPTVAPTATAITSATPPPPVAEEAKPEAVLPVEGANLTIGSITADGFTLTDVACKSDDAGGLGGLVLAPALAGVLGKKKAALRACAPKGGQARVRFDMSGGRVTGAEAKADTPQVEACVVRTVKSMQAPLRGRCAVTIDLSR